MGIFTKSLAIITFATVIAVLLLGFRQQRLATMHEMARLHSKMNQSRQTMWDMQVRIADRLDPARLTQAVDRAKLRLEPSTPGAAEAVQAATDAHGNIRNRSPATKVAD
ncbi:MAG: hypothetical protein K8S99_17060 [Planctomycetes bacterium]|nr:hypothetical protein [Planctomycetota bacterium]